MCTPITALVAGVMAAFDQVGIDAVGVGGDVHQHGQGAGEEHRAGSGNEGEIGKDDLVARTDTQRCQGYLQGGGAVGDGDAE
jgi:hypothetical protein